MAAPPVEKKAAAAKKKDEKPAPEKKDEKPPEPKKRVGPGALAPEDGKDAKKTVSLSGQDERTVRLRLD